MFRFNFTVHIIKIKVAKHKPHVDLKSFTFTLQIISTVNFYPILHLRVSVPILNCVSVLTAPQIRYASICRKQVKSDPY